MLGFSRRQCLDERDWWRSHVHPDDRHLLEQTFARALEERGAQRCDHRCVTSGKAILWLHTSVHLADVPGEAPRFQGLSCDITAARTEQDQARELYDEARHAVELREQALAAVSHELKSPLATIMMASKILGDDELADRGPAARSVEVAKIRHATSRMERLVGDLPDFASIGAGCCAIVATPQDVAAIITESVASFEHTATRRG